MKIRAGFYKIRSCQRNYKYIFNFTYGSQEKFRLELTFLDKLKADKIYLEHTNGTSYSTS